ncbi:MAG: class I SAM-dependent methyltransferase [Verrucomicrobiota bacterium]
MDYLTKTYTCMASNLDPDQDYFETDSRFMTLELLLRAIPKGMMCDIGCGRGALMKRMGDYHTVYGCDFAADAVEACVRQGLVVKRADLNNDESLPFAEKFNVIVMSEVCEHLLDPRNAIRVAQKALIPGGILIVTVPNAVPLFVRCAIPFGKTVRWLHYPSPDTVETGHIRFYTIKSMSVLLEEEGFKVCDVRGVSFRMNGYFWARVCFWTARLFRMNRKSAPARIDAWFGRCLPGLSPGLLFLCERPVA